MNLIIIDSKYIFQKDVIGNVRKAQEDSHDFAALTANGNVFVVCDGMGGHVGGKQASSIAVKSIIEYLRKEKYPDPEQALKDALQFANMQILGYANEHPELKGMGTTACIVLTQDTEAYIAHVGDSRIYLYLDKEKELHRITKDHSFVQALVDAGQITDEEAEHHPNKNRILKALGVKPDLEPSTDKVLPKNGDVFLICSDGLSGMISDSTMRDVLAQDTSIENKGESLINLALAAGGLDNITLELVQTADSPHVKSVFRSYNPTSAPRRKPKKKQKSRKGILSLLAMAAVFVLFGLAFIFKIQAECNNIRAWQDTISMLNSTIPTDSDKLASLCGQLKQIREKINDTQKQCENSQDNKHNFFGNEKLLKQDTVPIDQQKNTLDKKLKEDKKKRDDLKDRINRRTLMIRFFNLERKEGEK